MEFNWTNIIKLTGPVGLIGLIFVFLLDKMFNAEIVALLGSEKMFYILSVLIWGLLIALILAVLKYKNNILSEKRSLATGKNKTVKVTYDNGSTHNGDNNF